MTAVRDDAVVLGRLDYSETSQILVLLTREHGKIRAIAKGVKRGTKKRFAVGVDLLDVGHVVTVVRRSNRESLAVVAEWRQTRSLAGLRESLGRLYAGQYLAEISAGLLEDADPHSDLFAALLSALATLCRTDRPLRPVVEYQCRLLIAVGSYPRFDACVLCGASGQVTHFSSHDGGMLCPRCEPGRGEKRAVSSATHRLFVSDPPFQSSDSPAGVRPPPLSGDKDGAPGDRLAGPFRLLNYHISHLMGKAPRLAAKLLA